ncbi:MAG: ABC transporter ATP-binding protein [Christensenellaceae bacterium]
MQKPVAVELKNITKSFGGKVANNNVSIDIRKGEILSLLGENGCGKTTLMNMLAGIYYPDSGSIVIDGKEAVIRSPKDSFAYKIGMIHQHFKLIDVFTATQNVILGVNNEKFNLKKVKSRILEMKEKYGFIIDPDKKVHEMSVSEKQTVEIVKVLFRGADILILDEPTAVLTPQETETLFNVLRAMRDDGKSIVIITHKLNEVLEISDRVTVLRKGEFIATVDTKDTDEQQLTEMMVGKKVELNIDRTEPENTVRRLEVSSLTVFNHEGRKVLDDVSFEAFSGEILGVAGIAGSGQRELLEAVAGLQKTSQESSIIYYPPHGGPSEQLIGKKPIKIRELGVRLSFIPEDRLGMGLVGNMDITDNVMLRSYKNGKGLFLDRKTPEEVANRIVDELKVFTPSVHTKVRQLSGGNIQKVLVGREISSAPSVLMAAYPVRGLDINSSYAIYNLMTQEKQSGVAVIFVGEDLDVLLELCDRIMVISGGKITGIVDARTTTKEEVGLLMTKSFERGENKNAD